MTNSVSSRQQVGGSLPLQHSSLVLVELMGSPMSSEWCMPTSLISMLDLLIS